MRGEPLPPLPPTPAPLGPEVLAAIAAVPAKAAAAAELEVKRAEVEASAKWKSPCKAIDAATALPCGLLKGHTTNHRHARGEFIRVATGPVQRTVDFAAWNTTK